METGGLGLGGVIVYGRGAGGLRLWGVSVGAPSAGSRGVPGARAGRVLWHLCVWVWPKVKYKNKQHILHKEAPLEKQP